MYGIVSTYPEGTSQNVGDNLITHSAKAFIRENCDSTPDFKTYFRGDGFSDKINDLNKCEAVFLPGFAIREPLENVYDIVKYLDQIEPPLVPLGSGWKSVPGGFENSIAQNYSSSTMEYISKISKSVETFGVREYYTKNALENNGVDNVSVVGDCAWYDMDSFGNKMHTPSTIDKIVLTTPHSSKYEQQAQRLAEMIANRFSEAKLICALHSVPTKSERIIADHCRDLGYEIRDVNGEVENIEFYSNCDLHIGYRVHGHIAFLRKRRPSILLNEDGRGAGFSYTFGTGGFNAFKTQTDQSTTWLKANADRSLLVRLARKTLLDAGYEQFAKAPPDPIVVDRVEKFVSEEIENGFQRYQHIPGLIERTYRNKMRPLIRRYVK